MRDAVHLERVETDFLEHRRCWRGAASAIPDLVCARASFRGGAALSSGRAEVAILRARMRLGQASPCTEQLLTQCARRIFPSVCAALLQFRDEMLDDVGEGLVGHGIGEIEAVDVGLLDPSL